MHALHVITWWISKMYTTQLKSQSLGLTKTDHKCIIPKHFFCKFCDLSGVVFSRKIDMCNKENEKKILAIKV